MSSDNSQEVYPKASRTAELSSEPALVINEPQAGDLKAKMLAELDRKPNASPQLKELVHKCFSSTFKAELLYQLSQELKRKEKKNNG